MYAGQEHKPQDEEYTVADATLLNHLKNGVKSITVSLDMTGTKKFPESIEVTELQKAVYTLIGELQFHNIIDCNLHVENGRVVRHLEPVKPATRKD